jgi:hypothetical protein
VTFVAFCADPLLGELLCLRRHTDTPTPALSSAEQVSQRSEQMARKIFTVAAPVPHFVRLAEFSTLMNRT